MIRVGERLGECGRRKVNDPVNDPVNDLVNDCVNDCVNDWVIMVNDWVNDGLWFFKIDFFLPSTCL